MRWNTYTYLDDMTDVFHMGEVPRSPVLQRRDMPRISVGARITITTAFHRPQKLTKIWLKPELRSRVLLLAKLRSRVLLLAKLRSGSKKLVIRSGRSQR